MKKKLTVNTLAFGNLKHRKKQYAIMIIGIILAMVFSCSMILYFFSSYEALDKEYQDNYGRQDIICNVTGSGEEVFKDVREKKLAKDYGIAHLLGWVYTENAGVGFPVAWLDDKAAEYSNISFIEGTYPTKDNEIAIEKTMLARLGIDAGVGDEITLNFKIQSMDDFLKEPVQKTYTLVGIAADKHSNICGFSDDDRWYIPAGFVAKNTAVDLGGKEKITAYIMADKSKNIYEAEGLLDVLRSDDHPDDENNRLNYFVDNPNTQANFINVLYESNNMFILIPIIALIVAAAVTIINAFNTNLSERKKQIGMLRAVGTTKKQIFKIFGREAFFISLICIPISIALSYLVVWLMFKISGTELVMTKSIWVLPVSAVLGMVIVLFSALVPLANAARITPIQAIRDIEKTRKMKTKKIKTQKSFDVSTLLSKRSLAFSKASQISVSVILIATISFSCLGFSYISYERANPYGYKSDYIVQSFNFNWDNFTSYKVQTRGIDEKGFQELAAAPYIEKAYGNKNIVVNLQIDEYNDYFKSADRRNSVFKEDWDNIDALNYDNFYDLFLSEFTDDYITQKEILDEAKEFIPLDMYSYDEEVVSQLSDCDIQGEINLEKLAAGEEVILLAPQTAAYMVTIDEKNGNWQQTWVFDGENYNEDDEEGYQEVCSGANPYKAGDAITLTLAEAESEETELTKETVSVTRKQVKIGAIVTPKQVKNVDYIEYGYGMGFITTNQGLNHFVSGAKYRNVYLFSNTEVDEDVEKTIRASIDPVSNMYNCELISNFEQQQRQQDTISSIYYSLLALITICFVICASIVNNTLSARIRESKKQIGTIRAFGANQTELVKSYFKQMISMLSVGIISGFAVYTVGFIVVNIYNKSQGRNIDLIFDPWLTLVFCVVLVAICTANLWLKVHKEMKNSIIENIREL